MSNLSTKVCSVALALSLALSTNIAYATTIEGNRGVPQSTGQRAASIRYCSFCREEQIYAKNPTTGEYVHIGTNTYDETYDLAVGYNIKFDTNRTLHHISYTNGKNYKYVYYTVTRTPY